MFGSFRAWLRGIFAHRSTQARKTVKPIGNAIEVFEGRIVPATIVWDSTNHPTGGSWDVGSNWIGGTIPGASDGASITLSSAGTVSISANDPVGSIITNSKTTFVIKGGGTLSLGAATTTFGGPVDVVLGGTLVAGSGTTVVVKNDQTLSVDGILKGTNGSTFNVEEANFTSGQGIVVNGSGQMLLTGATFGFLNGNSTVDTSSIQVVSGGHFSAADSTINWDVLSLNNGSILDLASNNKFNGTLYVPASDIPLLAGNVQFQDIDLNSGSATGTTLNLDPIGTITTNQRYIVPGLTGFGGNASPFTIQANTTVNVENGATMLVRNDAILDVKGTLNVTNAAPFLIEEANFTSGQGINVESTGTLKVVNSKFDFSGGNSSVDTSSIQVLGGHFLATNSTFGWDILALDNNSKIATNGVTNVTQNTFITTMYVPPLDVPFLTNNLQFQDVNLNSGSGYTSGTLELDPLGQNSSDQRYLFSGLTSFGGSRAAFDIPANGTVIMGAGDAVVIRNDAVVTVDGALNINNPASFLIEEANFTSGQGIIVEKTGTLTATNAVFSFSGGNSTADTSSLEVVSGGVLDFVGGKFGWDKILFDAGSNDTMQFMLLASPLTVNSVATLNVHENDFTVATIVAAGGSSDIIDFTNNYWGSTDPSQIQSQITDHNSTGGSALPTVKFDPVLPARPVEPIGASASTVYSGNSQSIPLTATILSPSGIVNEGQVTFTILQGLNTIGSPVTVNVSNGIAFTNNYVIPQGTLGGTYIIQVTYNGTANFVSFTDSSHTLIINAVSSNTIAVSTSATVTAGSQTSVNITSTIQSSAGTVIDGSATFTVLNSSLVVVGSAVTGTVVNGSVTATYILPAGTSGGLYSIEVGYNGSESFLVSSNQGNFGTLTVNASPVFTSGTSATFVTGTSGNFQVAIDGFPAATFSIVGGSLPNGVALSSSGLLSGNAAEFGVFTFTIQASNGIGTAATQSFTLTVNAEPIITTVTNAAFQTTVSGSFQAAATGFPTPTFSEIGALPAGMTFSSSGLLTGTPTQSGVFTITIFANNGIGTQAAQTFTLTINDAPAFTSVSSAGFLVSTGGSFHLGASGFPAPTLTLTDSIDLPAGVTFNSATGILTVPAGTAAGVTVLTFTASNGIGTIASQDFTLTIGTTPIITSVDNASFLFEVSDAFTVAATGFPNPNFTETGTLPDGMTLDPTTGVLSGTPTIDGTFTFTITATSVLGAFNQSFTLTINAAPTITSNTSATFYTSAANSFSVLASGFPAPTFAVTNGSLPNGISLDAATGVLSGIPTQTGPFQFTITASNTIGVDATQIFNLDVQAGVAPIITSTGAATFAASLGQTFAFTASGNPAPTFTEVGALPSGITLASNGTLSGTTTASGAFTVTITATNALGNNSQTFTLTVTAPPAFTSLSSATFALNTASTFQAAATGFPAPAFMEVGTLPAGITLTSAGVLSGTPTESGSFSLSIVATNSISTVSQTFTLIVDASPAFTSANTATLVVNAFGSFAVTAAGFPGPAFTEIGALPSGVTLTPGGLLSGTPTQAGNFSITITASNGIGTAPTQSFLLRVQPPVVFLPLQIPDAKIGTPYAQTIAASGPPGPYTFTVTSGSLPPGMSLSASGVLSGNPTAANTYHFTITATASTPDSGTHDYSLLVNPAPTPITISGRSDGTAYRYLPSASGVYTLASVASPFPGQGSNSRTAVADVNGDGVPDTIFVTGPGVPIRVSILSGVDNSVLLFPVDPFGGDFTGGGFVAAADFDGDGKAEFAVTPDMGGGPRVAIFSLVNGAPVPRANYFTLDSNFRGGARVATGDVNGDGVPDLAIVAGFGGGPRVELINGKRALSTDGFNPADRLVNDFFAFDPSLRNGVYLAIGDVNGDGFGDLVLGGGPGGGPRILIVSGQKLLNQGSSLAINTPIANFFLGGDSNDRGGVRVAVTDADRDAKADVVAGTGGGQPSQARVYLGKNFTTGAEPKTFQNLNPFDSDVLSDGVYVG
jgi:hypothetical protein